MSDEYVDIVIDAAPQYVDLVVQNNPVYVDVVVENIVERNTILGDGLTTADVNNLINAALIPVNKDFSYHHIQSMPASVWNVNHNLGYNPGGIIVRDSSLRNIFGGEIVYTDLNNLTITFGNAFSGDAYIS